MSRGMPSMAALLGLLAIAGYQNRDKIGEILGGLGKGAGGTGQPGQSGHTGQQGGLGGILGGLLGGGQMSAGNVLSGGLGELVERFRQNGQGATADSWVSKGPNQPISPDQLNQAIGPDVMDALVKQTGLSREELLARLSRTLPEAVDRYTPDGRVPAAHET